MQFSSEQRQAIDTGGSVIVSAAAGAGKTAVLTERVVKAVCGGVPVQSLLVMTFTRAAAAEMKARIRARLTALSEAAADGAARAYLLGEARAVDGAQISTVHAFCARVLKRHAHVLGLPASPRILDDMTAAVLTERVRDELLTALSAEENVDWRRLLSAFGGEDAAWRAVTQTYAFICSEPDPLGWLDEAVARYADANAREALLSEAVADVKDGLRLAIDAMQRKRDEPCEIMRQVAPIFDDDLLKYRGLLLCTGYDRLREGLCELKYETMRFARGTPDAEKAPVKDVRERCKKFVRALADRLPRPAEAEQGALAEAGLVLSALSHTVRAFDEAYTQKKRAEGALDFSDLEHLTLAALSVPEIAAEYRARFTCVFVDEYQDSNRVQEAILACVRREDNLFLVGDVKQAIYRFREAEPTLFLEKLAAFSGGAGTRVDLNRNYRSAEAVIRCVNETFAALMRPETAEMGYGPHDRLVAASQAAGGAELHVIRRDADDMDGLEAAGDAEVEARFIAGRILELMQSETYTGPDGEPRPYRYSDFAVLLRGTTHAQRMAQVFAQCGVPCYVQVSGGYFDALEVQTMLDLLRVIDNRRQDVPLIAAMRSPAGDFSLEELIAIRTACPNAPFYEAVLAAAEGSAPGGAGAGAQTEKKARAFLSRLDGWRRESRYRSVEQLIGLLLDETGLYEEAGVCEGGAQRRANLDALIEKAHAFEEAGGRGVYGFLTGMALAEKNARFGAAQTAAADVVHLLTIHKSKGLEFPVVFLAQLGARFNTGDEAEALQLHACAGAGVAYFVEGRIRRDTATRMRIAAVRRREQRSEELRVLYVAMTRARQRLVMTGCMARPEDRLSAAAKGGDLSALDIVGASSMLQWLLLAARTSAAVTVHPREPYLLGGEADGPQADPVLALSLPLPSDDTLLAVNARFGWTYPHPAAVTLPAKTTVSAASGGQPAAPSFDAPAFMQSETDAAARGTAIHAALRYLPLTRLAPDGAEAFLDALLRAGRLSPAQAETVDRGMLSWFLTTPLYARMCQSPRVERELDFSQELPAAALFDTDADERVMLQGVIDGCFLENGVWTLVDYKTDRVPSGRSAVEVANRHARQLSLYAGALQTLSGIPVGEKWIVLLSAREAVLLP